MCLSSEVVLDFHSRHWYCRTMSEENAILVSESIYSLHMGKFLQAGNLGCLLSLFSCSFLYYSLCESPFFSIAGGLLAFWALKQQTIEKRVSSGLITNSWPAQNYPYCTNYDNDDLVDNDCYDWKKVKVDPNLGPKNAIMWVNIYHHTPKDACCLF